MWPVRQGSPVEVSRDASAGSSQTDMRGFDGFRESRLTSLLQGRSCGAGGAAAAMRSFAAMAPDTAMPMPDTPPTLPGLAIIGGGPAGLMAAEIARAAGVEVD